MNHYNLSLTKNQAQQKIFSRNELESRIKKLSEIYLLIMQYIARYDSRGGSLYASQETIAKWVGVSRATVNRAMRSLVRDGLIISVYRHRHTCVYHLADWFKIPSLRYVFYELLPGLKKSGLMLLMITLTSIVTPSQTQSYNEINFLNTTAYRNDWNRLKTHERMKLHAFSEDVLEFAFWKMSMLHNPRNIFAYLLTVCLDRAKDLGEKSDWATVERMKYMSETMRPNVENISRLARNTEHENDICFPPHVKIRVFKKEPQKVKKSKRPIDGMYSINHPLHITQERLIPRRELEQKLAELEQNPYGRIAAEVIRRKQKDMYESLTPADQEAWRQGR